MVLGHKGRLGEQETVTHPPTHLCYERYRPASPASPRRSTNSVNVILAVARYFHVNHQVHLGVKKD